MTYSLRAFAQAPPLKSFFESSHSSPRQFGEQSNQSLLSLNPLQTLKRVSGRLSQLLHGRDKTETPPPRRLLVVDDEESICFSMTEYFTHHGFAVETANEVEQAERMIKNGKYEVIIQDLRLGATRTTDGLDVIRFAHECSPETRIVVLTAYGSNEVEIEAKASGADAFLRKPQPLSQVAQVVRGLIESPRRWAAPPA
jgi:ActR/RegA family two-component response regulator